MLAERVNFKCEPILEWRCHRLRLQIDMNAIRLRDFHQPIDSVLRQHDCEQSILERVARKYVGKTGRYNRRDAQVSHCPSGMLAA